MMQDHYQLLHTIYDIVKSDPQPMRYNCRPRELILRYFQDWTIIQQQLSTLESEGLVDTQQENTLLIRITQAGMDRVQLPNSLVG